MHACALNGVDSIRHLCHFTLALSRSASPFANKSDIHSRNACINKLNKITFYFGMETHEENAGRGAVDVLANQLI